MRRVAGSLLTVLALAAIGLATLRNGDPAVLEAHGPLCLVCGNQGTVDVIQNLLLFAPLGAGLALLGVRLPVILMTAAAVSLFVESAQATVLTGRAATVSDLLTNTAGATLTGFLVREYRSWLFPASGPAHTISVAWAGIWVVVCIVGAWALLPAEQASESGPWHLSRIPPDSGHLREFEGTVLESYVGDVPVEAGTTSADDALFSALNAPTVGARARVTPMMYSPGKLRPIVSVHDSGWTAVLMLGQRYQDLSFSAQVNSRLLRLRTPSVRLQNVFPGTREQGKRRQAEILVSARRVKGEVVLESSSAVESRQLRVPVTPLLAWTTLAPFDLKDSPRGTWMTVFWLAAWLFPAGYWLVGGWLRGGSGRVASAVATAAAIGIPWLAALWSGLSVPAAIWFLPAALCVAVGWCAGTLVHRLSTRSAQYSGAA